MLKFTVKRWSRKLVSIGGWCGPALILGKLGLRTEAYPFDFSRCTLDGVIHFITKGFSEGFFPPGPPPFRPECVGIWVLFRGQHTAFAHFDLNDPKIIDGFHRKMERWDRLLDGKPLEEGAMPNQPVTFFRTIASRNPQDEIALIPSLEGALKDRNPNLDYRIVLVAHDQGLEATATELMPLSERCKLWTLEYTEDSTRTLFDRSQEAYATIVTHALDDETWKPCHMKSRLGEGRRVRWNTERAKELGQDSLPCEALKADMFPWRSHNNIALIDGVASVGGTCQGVGSTKCANGTCAYCGNSDYHKAGKPFRSNRPFTDEEDELLLIHLYKILSGGDKVEAVEQLAHEMNRGAFEVICRIQYLTQSSTKIADGLYPEGE